MEESAGRLLPRCFGLESLLGTSLECAESIYVKTTAAACVIEELYTVLLAKSLESAFFHFLAHFSAILCAIHTQVIPK